MYFVVGSVGWLIPLIACIIIGKEKNRNGFLWGFFLGIFGLIVLAILPPLPKKVNFVNNEKNRSTIEYGVKICPSCYSNIDDTFSSCPNCGRNLKENIVDISKVESIKSRRLEINNIIKCPKCNQKVHTNLSPEDFTKINCPFCNKSINRNNVIFE